MQIRSPQHGSRKNIDHLRKLEAHNVRPYHLRRENEYFRTLLCAESRFIFLLQISTDLAT